MREAFRFRSIREFPFARWAATCDRAAEAGLDVIRLDVGNPDLPPPDAVMRRLSQLALDTSVHRYPGFQAHAGLRQAIADYYKQRFGVSLNPDLEVLPLLGSKEGIIHLSLAYVDPGDVVLIPDPSYSPYSVGARLAGGEVVPLRLDPKRGFLPDLDAVCPETARKAVLMWLNYPNNPTGAVADLGFLKSAVEFAKDNKILLCHDAAYADIAYKGYRPPSVLEVPGAIDVAIEFNSLSKTFNMCGWRVGMAVGNRAALKLLARMKSNTDAGIFTPVQLAAAEALSTDRHWIEQQVAVFEERLIRIVDSLNEIGLHASVPRATHYIWCEVPPEWEAEAFALRLLMETGVSVAPGTFFGETGAHSIRLSVTAPTERICEASSRIVSMHRGWLSNPEASRQSPTSAVP